MSYQTDLKDKLQTHIHTAYVLFADYSFGENVGVCTGCCLRDVNLRILQQTPLHQIPPTAIADYLNAACGDTETMVLQIKYLLPRILELFLQKQDLRHSHEIIFDKLNCDVQGLWRDDEIAFLQLFFLDFLSDEIHNPHADFCPESICIMAYQAGLDFLPLLNQWVACLSHPNVLLVTAEWLNAAGGFFSQHAFADEAFSTKFDGYWADSAVREKAWQAFLANIDEFEGRNKDLLDDASIFL